MSETLKPCPFCGGEAILNECPHCGELNIEVSHADDCWVLEYEGYYDIAASEKEQYIAAWNRRAERTCHIVCEEYDDLLEHTSVEFSCGHYAIGLPSYFNYCPKCGAKVVDE